MQKECYEIQNRLLDADVATKEHVNAVLDRSISENHASFDALASVYSKFQNTLEFDAADEILKIFAGSSIDELLRTTENQKE